MTAHRYGTRLHRAVRSAGVPTTWPPLLAWPALTQTEWQARRILDEDGWGYWVWRGWADSLRRHGE